MILAWGLETRDCQRARLDGEERVCSGSSRVGLSVSHSGTSQLSGMSASRAVDPGKVDPPVSDNWVPSGRGLAIGTS